MQKAVKLYKTQDIAPAFFQELASMKHNRPSIDIDRRRRHINISKKANYTRKDTFEFFKQLERLGLGKLEVVKDINTANSKFWWTHKDLRPIDFAQDVIDMALNKVDVPLDGVDPSLPQRVVYTYTTLAGKKVELTPADIIEIKKLF